MNNQSTNNNANSLSDLFATGEGATTNQVSSTNTVNQPSSIASQSSQTFTNNQATIGNMTNQQSTISQNNVGMTGVTQQVMPNQGITTQIPNANVETQQSVLNQNSVERNNGSHQVIPNQEVIANQTLNNMPNQNISNSVDDSSLLKAFIGANYDKITKRDFNFAAFFFTSFYMFYRKMLWQGLVVYCVTFAANKFLGSLGTVIPLILSLIVGSTFNKFYVKYAIGEVERIKQENPNDNSNAMSLACFSKGGTSVGNIFLGLFIVMVISTIFGMIFPSTAITTI